MAQMATAPDYLETDNETFSSAGLYMGGVFGKKLAVKIISSRGRRMVRQ